MSTNKKKVNTELLASPYLSEWGKSTLANLEISEEAEAFMQLAKKLKISEGEKHALAIEVNALINNEQLSLEVAGLFVNYFNEKVRINCSDLGSETKEFVNNNPANKNKKSMFRRGE
jgi:hypothetical protein